MSRAIELWLDDETEQALAILCSTGESEADAIREAVIDAATRTGQHPLVNNPDVLEKALDHSHDVIAEAMTHRSPR